MNGIKKWLRVYKNLNIKLMIELINSRIKLGYPICYIDMFCDIAYYAIKAHPMLAKRDFVIQRCWKDYGEGKDKVVYNHSVNHSVADSISFFFLGKLINFEFLEISTKKRCGTWYSLLEFHSNKTYWAKIMYSL